MLRPRLVVGIWGTLCLLAALYGHWRGDGAPAFDVALIAFAVLLAGELWLAAPAIRERLSRASGSHGGLPLALWPLGAYLVYALGTGTMAPRPVAVAVVYAAIPLLLEASARGAKPGAWQDYAAMLSVYLPLKLGWLHDEFPKAPLDSQYTFTLLFAINVALAAFLVVRRMEGVGYSIGWRRDWAILATLCFLSIALIDIPAGIVLRFMQFDPGAARWHTAPVVLLGTFLFTAWPEEFLFRGLLQRLLQASLRNETAGWIAAAVVFGISHIAIGVYPNWRYVLLASVAGVFYGLAWRKTGSIFPGAIVHAVVDVTWHLLFRTV